MPGVRVSPLGPLFTENPPIQADFLRFLFCFCGLDDCCFVVVLRQKSGWSTSDWNSQIPNLSLIGTTIVFTASDMTNS